MRRMIVVAAALLVAVSVAGDPRQDVMIAMGSLGATLDQLKDAQAKVAALDGELSAAGARFSAAVGAVIAAHRPGPFNAGEMTQLDQAKRSYDNDVARINSQMKAAVQRVNELQAAARRNHDVAMNAIRNMKA